MAAVILRLRDADDDDEVHVDVDEGGAEDETARCGFTISSDGSGLECAAGADAHGIKGGGDDAGGVADGDGNAADRNGLFGAYGIGACGGDIDSGP